MKRSERALAWLFVGPALLVIGLVVVFPLAYSLWLSFTDVNLLRATGPALELWGMRVPLFHWIGARKQGITCEVTTFRADTYDRVSRNPEVRFGDSIVDDLVRRDFTVNAMAVDLSTKEFVDPHGGLRRED